MGRQAFGVGEHGSRWANLACSARRGGDQGRALEKRVHRYSRRMARSPPSRQNVAGAGDIIAQRFRCVNSEEDRAGVTNAACQCIGPFRRDLYMFWRGHVDAVVNDWRLGRAAIPRLIEVGDLRHATEGLAERVRIRAHWPDADAARHL